MIKLKDILKEIKIFNKFTTDKQLYEFFCSHLDEFIKWEKMEFDVISKDLNISYNRLMDSITLEYINEYNPDTLESFGISWEDHINDQWIIAYSLNENLANFSSNGAELVKFKGVDFYRVGYND